MENIDATYKIQGLALTGLAKQFGTPLYVYDAEKIISQLSQLKEAFEGVPLKIKYAVKALSNVSILRLMKKYGAGVDVVSIYEARLALHAGFEARDIMFTPNGVHFNEIVEAVELGLAINIDNLPALEKFGKQYGHVHPCCLRINPSIMAGGNLKISTGHSQSKFGIPVQQLPEVLEIVERNNIQVNGLHIHTGSEITEIEVFLKMAEVLFNAAIYFNELKFIDFGSGFKVAYREGDKVTDIKALGKQLVGAFSNFCRESSKNLELWIEPGKFLVSESGYLLVETNVVKANPNVTFAGVDSGLNHLIRPMLYDAYHGIVNLSNPQGPKKNYQVVGNICETDTFGTDRELNEVREGDILAILNAGAYGYSMSSNYNSRPRPAEVLVISGEAKLIRKRESLEDLLRGQVEIGL